MESKSAGDIVVAIITIALCATALWLFVWKILPGLLVFLLLPELVRNQVGRPSAGE
ncbi:MAG: hypothetical protein OXH70_17575 [Acidobacteria bacterium]|nr:hypothetical protein [Acidobacteriota bacterium]